MYSYQVERISRFYISGLLIYTAGSYLIVTVNSVIGIFMITDMLGKRIFRAGFCHPVLSAVTDRKAIRYRLLLEYQCLLVR